jgi:hypothetical protein
MNRAGTCAANNLISQHDEDRDQINRHRKVNALALHPCVPRPFFDYQAASHGFSTAVDAAKLSAFLRAITQFRRAIALQPESALLWVSLVIVLGGNAS